MNTPKQTFPATNKSVLHNSPRCGKILVIEGWLICPTCRGRRILKLLPTTKVTDLPVYCKSCRSETIVNIPTQEPEP